jgi:hypothetical protein
VRAAKATQTVNNAGRLLEDLRREIEMEFAAKISQSECTEHFGGSTDAVRGTVDKAFLGGLPRQNQFSSDGYL